MEVDPTARRLESVQVLRGLAASAVIVSHVALEIQRHSTQLSDASVSALGKGRAGVDVFFVISGFVMAYAAYARFGSAAESRRFISRRLARVVPIYWFYTTLILIAKLMSPSVLRHTDVTLQYTLASYLFFPFPQPGTRLMSPLLELGWTLNYEMYFYALFALAILFSRRVGLVLLAAYFIAAVLAGFFIDKPSSVQFWSRPVILEFLAGVCLGLAFRHGIRVPQIAAFVMAACGLIWFVVLARFDDDRVRALILGVPAFLVVAAITLRHRDGARRTPGLLGGFLLILGDASYSLYLSHMFVLRAATTVVHAGVLGSLYLPVYVGTVMVAAVLVAIASYRMIELPCKAMLERWLDSNS